MLLYIFLSIGTTSPVYCMGTEDVPKTLAGNSSTFMSFSSNVAAAWIVGLLLLLQL